MTLGANGNQVSLSINSGGRATLNSTGEVSIKSENTGSELRFGENISKLSFNNGGLELSYNNDASGRTKLYSNGEISIVSDSTDSHLYFREGSGELAFGGNALKLGYNSNKAYLDADGKLVIRGDSESSINFGNLTIRGEGSMSGPS